MNTNARMQNSKSAGTHTSPLFWIHMVAPPSSAGSARPSPLSAPNTANVIAQGSATCITLTPRLPNPALRPSDNPCILFGKKKLMLDIDEANAPPPIPLRAARAAKAV
jgi:hypothetical protein